MPRQLLVEWPSPLRLIRGFAAFLIAPYENSCCFNVGLKVYCFAPGIKVILSNAGQRPSLANNEAHVPGQQEQLGRLAVRNHYATPSIVNCATFF